MKKLIVILSLLFAAARCVSGAEESEVERLRRENAELREMLNRERARARDQALFLAAVADLGEFTSSKDREAWLLTRLSALCNDGEKLAVKAAETVAEMRRLLRELPMDTARRAQLQLLTDELERQAGVFAALVEDRPRDPAQALRECRVLAVNKELGVVLMDIGFRQGAFVGLVLRGGEDKSIEIRLEDVRAGVSAAVMKKGSLRDVAPGMVFNAETRVKR
jgi:hypothetical protein